MEETGMTVDNLFHKGKLVVEYPDRIYHFDIFTTNTYMGNPQEFDENFAMWIDIDELLAKDKKLPVVYIIKQLLQEGEVNVKIFADEKNNVIAMQNYL